MWLILGIVTCYGATMMLRSCFETLLVKKFRNETKVYYFFMCIKGKLLGEHVTSKEKKIKH